MAIIPAQEKVFMVSNDTNTTYGGSDALQAMNQWYTMEDVSNTVKPYKVFTALLTQSGDNDPRNIPSDTNSLSKGRTYEIVSVGAGEDVTLYGAPNNNPGTYFMCTVDTEVFTSELNYNQGAPVATVLENTLGDIWFTYTSVGDYLINSNTLFIINKTTQFLNSIPVEEGCLSVSNYTDGNLIYLNSQNGGFDRVDGYFSNTPIEIRVYN